MVYCAWKDSEVVSLLQFIKNGKRNGKSLLWLFKEYAKNSGRKTASVRNYYYAEIRELKQNKEKRERLNIDLAEFSVSALAYFQKEEQQEIITKINTLTKQGLSVRKACEQLANRDAHLMLRYQNKYRNETKKQQMQTKRDNVVKMPIKKTSLTDKDIESLFLGLVRIIKKGAQAEAENQVREKMHESNEKLSEFIKKFYRVDSQAEELKQQNGKLREQNEVLKSQIIALRCKIVAGDNLDLKKEKSLKKFMKNLGDRERRNDNKNIAH